jgi:site-specific DNA-methyltransferase (adenine-specific)
MDDYIQGNIHDVIKSLRTNSIDCIYTNPPFGTTENKWDTALKWDMLWDDIWRVLKPNGVAIIHASMPFSYDLIVSQRPKYHFVWVKDKATNFFHAKKQPLRKEEEIYIFYKKSPTYNPQMIGTDIRKTGKAGKSKYYGSRGEKNQGDTFHIGKYPTNILEYPRNKKSGFKTTPKELVEFLIKSYTNEGDMILDMTCHSDYVGKIISNIKRNYIGVDINEIIIS